MKCRNTHPSKAFQKAGNRGFTLIELLVVISVIGILASMIVGVSGVATTKSRLSQSSALLHKVSTAIDNYQADLGSYPPDARKADGTVNPTINPLYYELTGTVYNDNQGVYTSLAGSSSLRRSDIRQQFGRDGFQNVARLETETRGYLDIPASEFSSISASPDVRVLTTPLAWPLKQLPGQYENVLGQRFDMESLRPIPSADPKLARVNPWQYKASGLDRFNQQSYDLWVDLVIGTKVYRVNNWSGAPRVYEALP